MSDNTFNLVNDSESKNLSASRMGISRDSHIPFLDHDHLETEVIPLSDDSDSKRVYEDSQEEDFSSFDSLVSLLSYVGGEVPRAEVLMPSSILTEEETQANRQMREYTINYTLLFL